MSKKSIWLLPFVLVMLLGLAPELSEYRAINPLTSLRRGGVLRLLVVVLLAGAPLVVLALGLLRLTRWRMRSTPATLWIFAILSYGIVASVVLASAAGLGSANAIVHGFALTFAVTGMVAFMVQAPMHYWGGAICHLLCSRWPLGLRSIHWPGSRRSFGNPLNWQRVSPIV